MPNNVGTNKIVDKWGEVKFYTGKGEWPGENLT